ncbi:hypothetical protein ACMXYQ_05950 [Neptuniibacter sp. PT34_22]|uniref:toxin-antitoxin system YwqK family antitoxin n=1 Tax=Neptuniibacter sp. PT34_22 TaxID=3398205 RepID=UPI0039F46951
MAENYVSVTANLSKTNDFSSWEVFLEALKEDHPPKQALKKLLESQDVDFSVDDFTEYEYLTAIDFLKINKKTKTIKAEFNTGTGVVEFCNELNRLLKLFDAEDIKIKAIDDEEFSEIDWEIKESSSHPITRPFKKPSQSLNNGLSGLFDVQAPDGHVFARVNLKSGHLDGAQQLFYISGEPNMNIEFRDGVPHGKLKIQLEDGSTAVEAVYENGMQDGPVNAYKNGHCWVSSNFTKGKIHGHQKVQLDPNSPPYVEATYKYGQPDGSFHWQDPSRKIREVQFQNGKLVNVEDFDLLLVGLDRLEQLFYPHKANIRVIDPEQFYSLINPCKLIAV